MDGSRPVVERKPRPQKEQALNCPRCNSTNTKFCYYNNYSLSQPRYFCKTCRRYWTEGGSLRNVPVGGGSRKNKRSLSTTTSSTVSLQPAAAGKKIPDLTSMQSFPLSASQINSKIQYDGQDLNLAYPPSSSTAVLIGGGISEFVDLQPPYCSSGNKTLLGNPSSSPQGHNNRHHLPPMELLKPGIASRGLMNSFMSMPLFDSNTINYSSSTTGLNMQEFKPGFKFSMDGFENAGYGDVQETGAPRLFFPLEELRSVSSTSTEFDQQNRGQGESNGNWNGILGGGTW